MPMIGLKIIVGYTEHDPLAALGFLLLGLAGWLSFVVLRRLDESKRVDTRCTVFLLSEW